MKIAITGHRPIKLDNDYDLKSPLIENIKKEIVRVIEKQKPNTLITGMALGIDTLFALIAIEYNIPFIAAIPCLSHDSKWLPKSQQLYHQILDNKLCTIKLVNNLPYNHIVMQLRNQWMVDNCDMLIAVWDKSSGGTANCVKYAVLKNKQIHFINPDHYRISDLNL